MRLHWNSQALRRRSFYKRWWGVIRVTEKWVEGVQWWTKGVGCVHQGIVKVGFALSRTGWQVAKSGIANGCFLLCTMHKNVHGPGSLEVRKITIFGVRVRREIHDWPCTICGVRIRREIHNWLCFRCARDRQGLQHPDIFTHYPAPVAGSEAHCSK